MKFIEPFKFIGGCSPVMATRNMYEGEFPYCSILIPGSMMDGKLGQVIGRVIGPAGSGLKRLIDDIGLQNYHNPYALHDEGIRIYTLSLAHEGKHEVAFNNGKGRWSLAVLGKDKETLTRFLPMVIDRLNAAALEHFDSLPKRRVVAKDAGCQDSIETLVRKVHAFIRVYKALPDDFDWCSELLSVSLPKIIDMESETIGTNIMALLKKPPASDDDPFMGREAVMRASRRNIERLRSEIERREVANTVFTPYGDIVMPLW